jgi:hypothetical protein
MTTLLEAILTGHWDIQALCYVVYDSMVSPVSHLYGPAALLQPFSSPLKALTNSSFPLSVSEMWLDWGAKVEQCAE